MFDLIVKKLPDVLFPRDNVTTAHRIKLCGRFRNMTSSKFGCCISSIDTISCTVCRGYTTTFIVVECLLSTLDRCYEEDRERLCLSCDQNGLCSYRELVGYTV